MKAGTRRSGGCEHQSGESWLTAQTYKEQSRNLAGQIAFLKMQSTRFAGEIADDAVNIFGGRGLTKTGYVFRLERL